MQLANQSLTDVPLPPADFHPSRVAQAVNVLWFSSLILSLFAALYGIFVKQWLNTYSNWSDIADPQKAVLVRDVYRQGLKSWHVPNILATLPLLLQLALLFFVVGLVTYLWTVDYIVAGFISVLVSAGIVVAVVAIILPVYFDGCSYKSPIGLLLVRVLRSNFSSWRERDLDVLERGLPRGEDKGMHAYQESCALLEIAPGDSDGWFSKKQLVSTRVNDLQVHADALPFNLLRNILTVFAHGEALYARPDIIQTMSHVLGASVSAGKNPMPISVIQGFVKHVTEMPVRVLESPDAIEEQISSIHALASCIARHRTTFKMSGLSESATRLRNWFQQWGEMTSGSTGKDIHFEKNWPTLDGVLRQRSLLIHPASVMSAVFSQDGSQIVSGSDDSIVRIWDSSTGEVVQELKGHSDRVSSISVSPDGTRIVSGSYDQTLRVWDADSGAELQTLKGHTDWVRSVAFSPDGTRIVSGSHDRTVRVWDADSGTGLQALTGHTGAAWSAAFSPDGSRIVSGSEDETPRIWDANTGAELRICKGNVNWVLSVAFSPDGTRIVSSSSDRTVRVWDANSGEEIRTLDGHTYASMALSVAFSPDGTRIAAGMFEATVRVWDVDSGAVVQTLEGHTLAVQSVAFSRDGRRIVSGSNDESVRVWDVDLGVELRTLKGHSSPAESAVFSSDGTSITCQTESGASHTWTAPRDFPLPRGLPRLASAPSAPSSPIFTLESESGWILVQKDSNSPSQRLFWVATERSGELWSHGHCVLISSYDYEADMPILTLLDFTRTL
jgi:WD40 repeat protein